MVSCDNLLTELVIAAAIHTIDAAGTDASHTATVHRGVDVMGVVSLVIRRVAILSRTESYDSRYSSDSSH